MTEETFTALITSAIVLAGVGYASALLASRGVDKNGEGGDFGCGISGGIRMAQQMNAAIQSSKSASLHVRIA